MNVISWLWNPPLVKKFIGVERMYEKQYEFRSRLIELQQDWMSKKRWAPPKQPAKILSYLDKNKLLR